jgi:hypothetical protein
MAYSFGPGLTATAGKAQFINRMQGSTPSTVGPTADFSTSSGATTPASAAAPATPKQQFIQNSTSGSTQAPATNASVAPVTPSYNAATQSNPTSTPAAGSSSNPAPGTYTPPGTANGQPITAAPSNPYDSYSKAFDIYAQSLKASPEEQQAKTYLNNLITQRSQDVQRGLNSGETQGFANALADKVNREDSIGIDSASRGLEALTSYRSANTDSAKARADYLGNIISASKPVSVAPGSSLVNPITGDTVASGGSLADKNALDTFFNLQQAYPDAKIAWDAGKSSQANLQAAQDAAAQSPTYQAKSTTMRSIQLPGGGIGFYNSKDNSVTDGNGVTTFIDTATAAADKADAASLKKQQDYSDSTQRAFNTANANLQQLVTYMQQAGVNNGSTVPLINDLENKAKAGLLDPGTIAAYKAAIAGLRAEYAQVLSRGGEVTEGQRAQANSLIPDNLTPAQLQQVTDRLKIEGGNAISEAQGQISTINSRMQQRIQKAVQGSAPPSSPAPLQNNSADPLGIL